MRCAGIGRTECAEVERVKLKKTGFLTKLVLLALFILLAVRLLDVRAKIQSGEQEQSRLTHQVAQVKQENSKLSDAIANKDDPGVLESVARDKGFVGADERLFIDPMN